KYFDPGIPAARAHIVDVVMEVVRKYDVDGIHLDDYFYPYPISGQSIPDHGTYVRHGKEFKDKNEWRRYNVDDFIATLSDSIYYEKPWVKFGVSPFGVWRNVAQDVRGSATKRSLSAYDELFADTRKWLMYGWVDYLAPQLYWGINGSSRANFRVLLDWWSKIVPDRHIYIGHALYLMNGTHKPKWADATEFTRQAKMCREANGVLGNIWFRASSLLANPNGFSDMLAEGVYRYPALVPAMPWLDSIPPNHPDSLEVTALGEGVLLKWQRPQPALDNELPAYYVIYRFDENEVYDMDDPRNIVAIRRQLSYIDDTVLPGKEYTYVITSVDRLHNESERFVYQAVTVLNR
ncbi:MAG: family 10 glycosylhydrolase, partial [Bacteroidota bacterium]